MFSLYYIHSDVISKLKAHNSSNVDSLAKAFQIINIIIPYILKIKLKTYLWKGLNAHCRVLTIFRIPIKLSIGTINSTIKHRKNEFP